MNTTMKDVEYSPFSLMTVPQLPGAVDPHLLLVEANYALHQWNWLVNGLSEGSDTLGSNNGYL